MIDDQCPRCKEYGANAGNDRDVQTCPHCGGEYQTVQMGWCFHNIPYPHDCSEHMGIYGGVKLCGMCGGSNEESTKARIAMLRQPENEGNDLAEGLASALERTIKDV